MSGVSAGGSGCLAEGETVAVMDEGCGPLIDSLDSERWLKAEERTAELTTRPLIDSLDSERWLKAEERTAELTTRIQPNQPSEERRNVVADYVQRLILICTKIPPTKIPPLHHASTTKI
ncbi:hypothetical protein Tco_0456713 [Tanacetum coccineum]